MGKRGTHVRREHFELGGQFCDDACDLVVLDVIVATLCEAEMPVSNAVCGWQTNPKRQILVGQEHFCARLYEGGGVRVSCVFGACAGARNTSRSGSATCSCVYQGGWRWINGDPRRGRGT